MKPNVIYSGRKNTRLYNLFEAISTEKVLLNNYVEFYYTMDSSYYKDKDEMDQEEKLVVHIKIIDRFPSESKFESDKRANVEIFDYTDYIYDGKHNYMELRDWVYEKIHHMPQYYSEDLIEWGHQNDKTMVILATKEHKLHKKTAILRDYITVLQKCVKDMLFLYLDGRLSIFWENKSRLYNKLGFEQSTVFPAISIHTQTSHYHCKFLNINIR